MTKRELINLLTTLFSGVDDDTNIAIQTETDQVFDIKSIDYRSENQEEGYLLLMKDV